MAFYDSVDFIDAFRNGGCFIFEGEEGDPDVTEEAPEDTSVEKAEESTPDEGNEGKSADENTEESTEGQPADDSPEPEVDQVNTAETVNSDDNTASRPRMNADQIVKAFMGAKQLAPTLQYAYKCIGNAKQITLKMVEPYIRAAVEKFCGEKFNTTVEDIANAISSIVKSLGAKHVQKIKAMAAKAEKNKENKEAESHGESGGDEAPAEGGSEEAPTEAAPAEKGGGDEELAEE